MGHFGIKIGLAHKLDPDMPTPHKWREFDCFYNCQNGLICRKAISPRLGKFVERGGPNDVVQWTIACSNIKGQVLKSAVLKINGVAKGKPIAINGEEDLFPTIHIASSEAELEAGYHDMEYPENVEGKLEN